MKRVIIIANAAYPEGRANSVNVFRMGEAFHEAGFSVTLIARKSARAGGMDTWHQTCSRYGGRFPVKGRFLHWPFSRGAEPALAVRSLFHLLFQSRGVLVFTRVRYAAVLAAFLGYRTVFESHAPPGGRLAGILETWIQSRPRVLLVLISEGLRKAYAARGLSVERPVIAPDAGRQLLAEMPGRGCFQGPCRNLGYIGSLYAGRGVEIIAEAARLLPDRRFHLFGSLQDLAGRELRLPPNVFLYDAVTPDQAERLGILFDALLMPYQEKVEIGNRMDTSSWMSPMKLFEYMLSGQPVVSSDLPVLREILTEGENALLVPPADAEAWAAAIRRLDDPALRHALAGRAFAHASASFTWKSRLEAILGRIPGEDGRTDPKPGSG